jgi:hypothetical protein
MRLFDSMFRKFCAYVADYGNRPGDANEVAEAFEAYDGLVQDIRRGASAEELGRNKLFQKSANNGAARIA